MAAVRAGFFFMRTIEVLAKRRRGPPRFGEAGIGFLPEGRAAIVGKGGDR